MTPPCPCMKVAESSRWATNVLKRSLTSMKTMQLTRDEHGRHAEFVTQAQDDSADEGMLEA